jgi:D-sedoheptulose 7-phosphate isomerase
MNEVAKLIIECFKRGNKVLVIGNGGSCEMASHFAGEMVCKFEKERKPLPAIALNDPAVITAIANDFGFKYIFSRQIEALGKEGDILLIFTTSKHLFIAKDPQIYEHSENIAHALEQAKKMNIIPIFASRHGETTAEIQEYQLHFVHEISGLIEKEFEKR